MAQIIDLLDRPIPELSEYELKQRLTIIQQINVSGRKAGKIPLGSKKVKSNKDKRISDLLSGLSKKELNLLKKEIGI